MSRLAGIRESREGQRPSPTDEPEDGFDGEEFDEITGERLYDEDEEDGYEGYSDEEEDGDDDDLFGDEEDDLDALFDDILDGNDEADPVTRLADLLAGREENKKTETEEDEGFDAFFEKMYGEGLDFSSLFEGTDTDDETIKKVNEAMGTQFEPMLKRMTKNIMAGVMQLTTEHVKSTLDAQKAEVKAEQVATNTKSAVLKRLPWLKSKQHRPLFDELFETAHKRTNGNPRKTVEAIEKLYRKTNPEKFRNRKETSFSRSKPRRKTRKKSNADWENFLNG